MRLIGAALIGRAARIDLIGFLNSAAVLPVFAQGADASVSKKNPALSYIYTLSIALIFFFSCWLQRWVLTMSGIFLDYPLNQKNIYVGY